MCWNILFIYEISKMMLIKIDLENLKKVVIGDLKFSDKKLTLYI